MTDPIIIQAAILKIALYLVVLFFAWKFKKWLVAVLVTLLLITQLTVVTEQPPLLYVIASGVANPMLAWILYLYMRDTKK